MRAGDPPGSPARLPLTSPAVPNINGWAKVWILDRASMTVLGSFGSGGHNAGQFTTVYAIATDSQGNIYTGETWEGKRVQRFKPTRK